MPLDSRYLRAFVALADDLHFGRTAERLGIAQSVLSLQVKRIEDVIGGRLLERGRRATVGLTPAGRTFLEEARGAIDRLDQAERIGRRAVRGEAGPAGLGYVFSAAMSGVLVRALAAVRERLPHLSLSALPMETPEQLAAVADGRLDAGLVRPRETYPPGVSARIVHREPLLLALSASHPLIACPHISPTQLSRETFIIPQAGEALGLSGLVASLCRTGGFRPRSLLDTGDFLTAASMAASGHGVVLAPRSLANLHISGLCYREIADFDGAVDLAIVWRGEMLPLVAVIIASLPDGGPPGLLLDGSAR